jgi:putative tricarboxylic transport membrane protein
MSDVQPSSGRRIRNPQDFYGGLALIVMALFALWALSDLSGMRGASFGPGTAPRMFAVLLGLSGAAIAAIGLVSDGPELERWAIRGPVLIVGAILFFAVSIRPLGLVVTSFVAMMISATASPAMKLVPSVIWSAIVTAFCAVLFPKVLNLPMDLWPKFLIQ